MESAAKASLENSNKFKYTAQEKETQSSHRSLA
jgi:hypothetical protein